MKAIHLLAALLMLAMILVDGIVVRGFHSGYETPLMLFLGLACGQLALLSCWLAAGTRAWLPRLLVTIAMAAALSRPLGHFTAGKSSEWFLLFGLFVVGVTTSVFFARWRGRSSTAEPQSTVGHAPSARHWTQYSLASLVSLMTVVGLALGLSRHVAFPVEYAGAVTVYGCWLIVVAQASLWAILSSGAVSLRLLLLAALCLVAGQFMTLTEHYQSVWFFTMIAVVEAVVICLGMSVLQAGGVRDASKA